MRYMRVDSGMRETPARVCLTLALILVAGCGRLGFQTYPTDAGPTADLGAADLGAADLGTSDLGRDDDAGRVDAGALDGAVAIPITVSNLRAEWETPHTIRWRWDRAGDEVTFASQVLVIGPTGADVVARTPLARVIDASENPELGFYALPFTSGFDPVISTIAYELSPATTYFAQLVVTLRSGLKVATPVADARTAPDASRTIALYDDAAEVGGAIPAGFDFSSDRPFEGASCYRFVAACAPAPERCWDTLRRYGLSVDTSSMPAESFADAYLEIAIASESSDHVYYGAFRLQVGMDAAATLFQIESITIRANGAYRVYEIPLQALLDGAEGMTWADLQRGVLEVGAGGGWLDGAIVRADIARIRW